MGKYRFYSKSGDGFYDWNQLANVMDLGSYTQSDLAITTIDGKLNGIPITSPLGCAI